MPNPHNADTRYPHPDLQTWRKEYERQLIIFDVAKVIYPFDPGATGKDLPLGYRQQKEKLAQVELAMRRSEGITRSMLEILWWAQQDGTLPAERKHLKDLLALADLGYVTIAYPDNFNEYDLLSFCEIRVTPRGHAEVKWIRSVHPEAFKDELPQRSVVWAHVGDELVPGAGGRHRGGLEGTRGHPRRLPHRRADG